METNAIKKIIRIFLANFLVKIRVDEWIAPTLLNSWVNYDSGGSGGHSQAGFFKDPFGIVHLRGLVKNGTTASAVIFVLPVGCRPKSKMGFAGCQSVMTLPSRISVTETGNVYYDTNGSTAWQFLDGVTFLAEN